MKGYPLVTLTMKPSSTPAVYGLLLASLLSLLPLPGSLGQGRGPRRGLPELADPVTSFGAAVLGDHLYVYSGHSGKAHDYSKDGYSKRFRRIHLRMSGDWEELEMQEPGQGLALVPWNGALYRVGGVSARNAPEEEQDMHSTDAFARFDPESGKWTALTPLPAPCSSLDAAVLDGKIYVLGGWKLSGASDDAEWATTYYVADLAAETIRWEALPQAPFQHRALAVAATDSFVYAVGGMDYDDSTTAKVFVFDPKAGKWSEGPKFPAEGRLRGFGCSAFGVGNTVWASGRSGRVYALEDGADAWRDTGYDLATPRFFHRLLPDGNGNLLFVGGAGKEGALASIESVDLTLLEAKGSARKAEPTTAAAEGGGESRWPGFRGHGGSRSDARNLPLHWSDEKNVAWTAPLDGYGQSSPVVWDGRVYVTSVKGDRKELLRVDCLDLASGKELWTKTFDASQKVERSNYVSQAAPTPVVDADGVYAFFESGDAVALTHEGELRWTRSLTKDYGDFAGNHGVGSSPALSSSGLVVLVEHDGPSYLICLDRATGRNVWKVDREARVSWSSPIVVRTERGEEVLVSSNGLAEAFDAATGERSWFFEGIVGNTVASPSVSDELLVVGSSEKGQSRAIRLGGRGDVSKSHLAWVAEKASSSFGSPLVHGACVYFVNRAGVAFCTDLATGGLNWSLRLPASCWASPIAAGDRVYFFSTNGTTTILQATPSEPVELAVSSLQTGDRVYGVAAVDGALVFRMESKLVCVRETP